MAVTCLSVLETPRGCAPQAGVSGAGDGSRAAQDADWREGCERAAGAALWAQRA